MISRAQQHLPTNPNPHQGFASGDLDVDAAALRMFAAARRPDGTAQEMLVAQSYSKNMGLYGERVGALSVVTSCPEVRRARAPCAEHALLF